MASFLLFAVSGCSFLFDPSDIRRSRRDTGLPDADFPADGPSGPDDAHARADSSLGCSLDAECGPVGLGLCSSGSCTVRSPSADPVASLLGVDTQVAPTVDVVAYRTFGTPFLAVATVEGADRRPVVRTVELHTRRADRNTTRWVGLDRDGARGLVSETDALALTHVEEGDASDVFVAAIARSAGELRVLSGRLQDGTGGTWMLSLGEPDARPPLLTGSGPGATPFERPTLAWSRAAGAWVSSPAITPVLSSIGRSFSYERGSSTAGAFAIVQQGSALAILRVAPTVLSGPRVEHPSAIGPASVARIGEARYAIAHAEGREIVVHEVPCTSTCTLDVRDAAVRLPTESSPEHLTVTEWPGGGCALSWTERSSGSVRLRAQWLTDDLHRPVLPTPLEVHVLDGAEITAVASSTLAFELGAMPPLGAPETSRVYLAIAAVVVEGGVGRIDLATLWAPLD